MGLYWRGIVSDGQGQKKHHISMMPSRFLESGTWQYYIDGLELAYCIYLENPP